VSTLTTIKTKSDSVREWQTIIGAGIFATGLAQPEVLALPFRRLLSEEPGADAEKMAIFFAITSLPWSLKILSGLLLDSIPFFGTRRFYYLTISAAVASLFWLLLNFFHSSFISMAIICMTINIFLVIASSAGGALFVESGQRLNAMDRFASTRVFVDNVNTVIAGPLSGWLAGVSFTASTFVGALIPLSLLPPVIALLKEPTTARFEESALRDAWKHIKIVVTSYQAWMAGLFLCLVCMSQSFPSLLFFHQTKELQFSFLTIGVLDSVAGLGGILATIVYGLLRRFQHLRAWLILGIICGSLDALIYGSYDSLAHAYPISLSHGFLITLSVMAMMEVAGWATPSASTALGFAFVASAWNTGIPLGDYVASQLAKLGLDFYHVAYCYAAISLSMLGAPFLLPKRIQMKD
jgi:MFS family permease